LGWRYQEALCSRSALAKSEILSQKYSTGINTKKSWRSGSSYLPSKCEALSSNPCTAKGKKKCPEQGDKVSSV
jgi:hypothetical protein